jgi:hypothetical protein
LLDGKGPGARCSSDERQAAGFRNRRIAIEAEGPAMVTTRCLRDFANDCLVWASHAVDPSQRQMMVDAARTWAQTAEAIERCVETGRGEVLPDLKSKLN